MRRCHRLFVVALFFALAVQCSVVLGAEDAAAWVNKKPISEAQVVAKMKPVLEMIHKKTGQRPDGTIRLKVRGKVLNSLIEWEVALASKKAQSVGITPEALEKRVAEGLKKKGMGNLEKFKASLTEEGIAWDAWRKGLEETMVIEEIKKGLAATCAPCTDREAQALYREKSELFQSGGRVKISLIKLDFDEIETTHGAHRFATGLANQLFDASGEAWENAVADYSSGPKADAGGHWDWIKPSLLPDGLGKVVTHMNVGEFEKIATGDYYYLIRLDAVEKVVQLTFEQAKDQVRQEVMRRKVAAAWKMWIKAEKKNASIKIKDEDLW